MEDVIQKKILDILLEVSGLTEENIFYLQADENYKSYPRFIFFEVSSIDSYDTGNSFMRKLVQVSCYNNYSAAKVISIKATAEAIREKLKISEFSGIVGYSVSRCKRTNKREEVSNKIFGYHQTFQIDFSKVS